MANTCPHCGARPCLSAWRKTTLGPFGSARCLACDCKVGIDVTRGLATMAAIWLFGLALLLLLLLEVTLDDLEPTMVPGALILFVVAVLAAAGLAHWLWVPLRVDELSNPDMVAAGRARAAIRHGRPAR